MASKIQSHSPYSEKDLKQHQIKPTTYNVALNSKFFSNASLVCCIFSIFISFMQLSALVDELSYSY